MSVSSVVHFGDELGEESRQPSTEKFLSRRRTTLKASTVFVLSFVFPRLSPHFPGSREIIQPMAAKQRIPGNVSFVSSISHVDVVNRLC